MLNKQSNWFDTVVLDAVNSFYNLKRIGYYPDENKEKIALARLIQSLVSYKKTSIKSTVIEDTARRWTMPEKSQGVHLPRR